LLQFRLVHRTLSYSVSCSLAVKRFGEAVLHLSLVVAEEQLLPLLSPAPPPLRAPWAWGPPVCPVSHAAAAARSLSSLAESRQWGHEAKQRPRRDEQRSETLVLITDPTQTTLSWAVGEQETTPDARGRGRPRTAWMDNIKTWTGLSVEESIRMTEDRDKWGKYTVRPWCGRPSDRERLKNRTVVMSQTDLT